MVFVLIGVSAPAVWIGLILAYVFGFKLGWTPIAEWTDPAGDFAEILAVAEPERFAP